jgi:DNA-binding response OmpR family regulator
MIALSGREAMAAARELCPDLILCDLVDPEFDTFELRRSMMLDPTLARVPFLFISDRPARRAQLDALRLGAADYLLKPLHPETLCARLVHFLESRRALTPLDAALSGPLEMLPCPSVLQCLEWNRSSGILHLHGKTRTGYFVFKDGAVIDARLGDLAGEEAAFELITIKDGEFVFDAKGASPIHELRRWAVQALLMDASWISDELERLGDDVPDEDDLLEVVDAAKARACFSHPAWSAFIKGEHTKAAAAIAEMLQIGSKRARVALGEGIRVGGLRVAGKGEIERLVVAAHHSPVVSISANTIGGGARVLVIDHDREIHRTLSPFFEAAGFEMHALETGSCAAEVVERLSPAVVIVDGLLPGVLGPEVCQAIRTISTRVPIIFHSAFFTDEMSRRLLRAECDVNVVLKKGCDARLLMEQVITLYERTDRDDRSPKSLKEVFERVREYDAALANIHARYREEIPSRLNALRRALVHWMHGEQRLLVDEAHHLSTSAGLYGFQQASELLDLLEEHASTPGMDGPTAMSAHTVVEALADLIDRIEGAFDRTITSAAADTVALALAPTTNPAGVPAQI